MRALLVVVALLAAAAPRAASPELAPGAPGGHLVLLGGGGEPDAVWAKIFELAGGKEARLVVLPTASEREETGPEYLAELAALGYTNTAWLPLKTAEDAARPEIVAALEEARIIFFSGGDQSRITAALLGSPALAAVQRNYRSGGVIAGTSAGLACMSTPMITGEGDFSVLRAANVELEPGLGFVTEAILDQHFVARQRQNRLISAVLEHRELLGIGVDERTAIWIRPDRTFEVLGDGWVMVFDARASRVERRADPAGRTLLGVDAMTTRVLLPGARFDLVRGLPLP